jgi:HEPN domain-containing protein
LRSRGSGSLDTTPQRSQAFISQFGLEGSEVAGILTKWLSRRARAHYVDFNEMGRLRAPFEEFDEADAVEVLRDCRVVIEFVKKLIKKTAKSDET